jgi:hypothetical protein
MRLDRRIVLCLCAGLAVSELCLAEDRFLIQWRRAQLSEQFYAEGATYGDLNRDGKNDVIAGPFLVRGAAYTTRHEISTPPKRSIETATRTISSPTFGT